MAHNVGHMAKNSLYWPSWNLSSCKIRVKSKVVVWNSIDTMDTVSLLWIPYRYYGYRIYTMDTVSILWIPHRYYGYRIDTMDTVSILWIPYRYYEYRIDTIDTVSILWIPYRYYGYCIDTMDIVSLLLGFKPIPECANLDSRVSDQGKICDSTY